MSVVLTISSILNLSLQPNLDDHDLHLGRTAASAPWPPCQPSLAPLPLSGKPGFSPVHLHLDSHLDPPSTLSLQSAPSSFTSYSPQFCCSALSYTTLPRRPAAPCWSPREGGGPYDGAGARTPREGGPYDGVGPRTSVRGDLPPPPHRGEVGHAAASPPASLGSETLSSYCEPWGQVGSTLPIVVPTQCWLKGGNLNATLSAH